jgi:hypothetical protein
LRNYRLRKAVNTLMDEMGACGTVRPHDEQPDLPAARTTS